MDDNNTNSTSSNDYVPYDPFSGNSDCNISVTQQYSNDPNFQPPYQEPVYEQPKIDEVNDGQYYDPNQQYYDPNAYDPNQQYYDPNAYAQNNGEILDNLAPTQKSNKKLLIIIFALISTVLIISLLLYIFIFSKPTDLQIVTKTGIVANKIITAENKVALDIKSLNISVSANNVDIKLEIEKLENSISAFNADVDTAINSLITPSSSTQQLYNTIQKYAKNAKNYIKERQEYIILNTKIIETEKFRLAAYDILQKPISNIADIDKSKIAVRDEIDNALESLEELTFTGDNSQKLFTDTKLFLEEYKNKCEKYYEDLKKPISENNMAEITKISGNFSESINTITSKWRSESTRTLSVGQSSIQVNTKTNYQNLVASYNEIITLLKLQNTPVLESNSFVSNN